MIISVPGRTFLNKVTCLCLLLYLSELSSMGLHSEKKAFQWNNGHFQFSSEKRKFRTICPEIVEHVSREGFHLAKKRKFRMVLPGECGTRLEVVLKSRKCQRFFCFFC